MDEDRTPDPMQSPDYREYSWGLMLAAVGTHQPKPERDTIGRVKMDYSKRRPPTTSETTSFNQRAATNPFNNFGI